MTPPKLILASGSPRRRQLLSDAGYDFEVIVPDPSTEEEEPDGPTPGQSSNIGPAEMTAELAYRKAADVARRVSSGTVIACDTVVECRGQILGKPTSRDHARQMLQSLQGSDHRVFSGLCVWRAGEKTDAQQDTLTIGTGKLADSIARREQRCAEVQVDVTTLRMDPLENEQIEEYLDRHQWEGKAGAFGYQDGLNWVHVLEGSESNVVGLPMELLAEMLERCD